MSLFDPRRGHITREKTSRSKVLYSLFSNATRIQLSCSLMTFDCLGNLCLAEKNT